MKKVQEAVGGNTMLGLALKSGNSIARKKLIQDCLYYERKILKLLRRLQSVQEGIEDHELQQMYEQVQEIGKEIDKLTSEE